MKRRAIVSTACFAVAAVCAGLLVWPEVTNRDRASVPLPSATPVLSLRRVPTLLARLAAGRRLQEDLDRAFAAAGPDSLAGRACLVVHDVGGRPLYARRPEVALQPASTVKLLTAATVLHRIGADTHLVTEVRAAGLPANGVVQGDLWLVGGGDPLLATAELAARAGPSGASRPASRLEDLADGIVAAGVRQVQGRLLGDDTRYDAMRYVPTWKPEYVEQGQSGPLSALTVNHGFTRLTPTPVPASAPAAQAAAALAVLLTERGVRVAGTGEGVAPAGAAVVAALESLPLGQIVAEMLQESDNTTAELLTKELGFRFGGRGSTAAGTDVIRATVPTLGPGIVDGVTLTDGSGLDRDNRATCGALTALLDTKAAKNTLSGALPVAGRNGTLAARFAGTVAAGRIKAKTGSLDGVTALSGYARDALDDEITFTILVNDNDPDSARVLVDRVAVLLVGYGQSPAAGELSPARR